jgi:hypothetical protein
MSARLIALLLAGFTLSCSPAFSQVPSDIEIRKILVDRVGAEASLRTITASSMAILFLKSVP